MKILEFFSEENGQLSNVRLNATILVFCACFITVLPVIKTNTVDANIISAATLMLTLGLGSKVIQKKDEQ